MITFVAASTFLVMDYDALGPGATHCHRSFNRQTVIYSDLYPVLFVLDFFRFVISCLPNGLVHPYHLDVSILNVRGVWCTL